MSELGDNLANDQNTQTKLKVQLTNKSKVRGIFSLTSGKFNLVDMPKVVDQADITGAFILGHSSYGVLGTSELGDGGGISYTVQRIVNPSNTWRTLLTSNETAFWNDTGNTTCTVDTTNQTLEFADGEIFQTNKLSTELGNITSATLSLSNVTGTLTYELSSDNGSNWETVSLDSEVEFSNPGTNLMLRITSTGTSEVSIKDSDGLRTPIKIVYVVANPAYEVFKEFISSDTYISGATTADVDYSNNVVRF